jgi:hypothetical protein
MSNPNYREMLGELGKPVLSGEIWQAFADAIRRAGEVVTAPGVPSSPMDRAEGYRYLTRLLNAALTMYVEFADKDYPEFGRFMDTSIKWGLDNVDCLYSKCSIRGDATYHVRGTGGSARYLGFSASQGGFGDPTPEGKTAPGGVFGQITNLNLVFEADGSFDLIVSPEPHQGNWLRIGARVDGLSVRQFFYDWENERPWYLTIERVGAEYPPPPLTAEQLDKRLRSAMKFINPGAQFWDGVARMFWAQPVNRILMTERGRSVTDPAQHYGHGWYRIEPDEALIVEVTPPADAHYWSFQVYNWWGESWDYTYRQASLNGHQARLDRDGKCRLVLAHSDPQVPNWIDLAAHVEGVIMVRYLLSETGPEPVMHLVKVRELRAHLPADTPTVDAKTRAETLRRRRHAVWRRFRD